MELANYRHVVSRGHRGLLILHLTMNITTNTIPPPITQMGPFYSDAQLLTLFSLFPFHTAVVFPRNNSIRILSITHNTLQVTQIFILSSSYHQ